MVDETDRTIMTASLPPDRISLFSNFDDEESWLMPVNDKSGELSDWLNGAMKDFDKTGLKKQKRKIQKEQQNNNSNGCDLITEEDDEIYYDAEGEFENDKSFLQKEKALATSTPAYKANVLLSNNNDNISTPKNQSKTKSLSPNPKQETTKPKMTATEIEKLAEEQERELLELLYETDSRPHSSASNFGNISNISARSSASMPPHSTQSPLAHETTSSSVHSCPSTAKDQQNGHSTTTLKPSKASKIPIPQRFSLKTLTRKSNGFSSHIPQLSKRPYSSGGDTNSDTSSNPDQWGGSCF